MNGSLGNATPAGLLDASPYSLSAAVVCLALAATLILCIVVGNTLVIVAIWLEPRLKRNRQNILIASLATADLLVGLLIMPLTLAYELIGKWIMGELLLLTCPPAHKLTQSPTACRRHPVRAVAGARRALLQRFHTQPRCYLPRPLLVRFDALRLILIYLENPQLTRSVTHPLTYPQKRTPRNMRYLVLVSWLASLVISLPPLVGWRPEAREMCLLSFNFSLILMKVSTKF